MNIQLKDVLLTVAAIVIAGMFYYICKHKSDGKEADYKVEMENLKIAHINDSLWNEVLQDSLNNIIDTILIEKSIIKHHYHEVYISIDSLTNDSAGYLLTNLLERHAYPKSN